MNEYKFEHESGKKGRFVVANTLVDARALLGENEQSEYTLVCAWDANGRKTYDIWYENKNTLPEDVDK